jgi:hypothetical protein
MQHKESGEQQALFQWIEYNKSRLPELALAYHVPNGGKRNLREAARLKKEGVHAGVPDICLSVARNGYHGMYIELKADKGKPTENQIEWMDRLRKQGYFVALCHGWESAVESIERYLKNDTGEFKGQEWD